MDIKEIIEALKTGENESIEFKSTPSQIDKEIVAFANTKGGLILIGVDDNGNVVGCDLRKTRKIVESLLQNIFPAPKIEIGEFTLGDKKILAIKIYPSTRLISVGGIAYIRIGTSKRPLSVQEILWLSVEKAEFRWDEQPTKIKYVPDWTKKFFEYRAKLRGNVRNPIKYLLSIKALKKVGNNLVFTNGGVLFFHPNPQEFFPHATVRVIIENTHEFSGPLPKLVDDVMSFLYTAVPQVETMVLGRRQKIPAFPFKAIREAVINAVIHRNYALEGDVRIFFSPREIRIRSPGGPMPGFSLEFPEHLPRNPVLCQLMYDIGYVEKYGYGLTMMREEVEKHGMVELEIKFKEFIFEVIFRRKLGEILDEIDQQILAFIKTPKFSSEIAEKVSLSKPAVVDRLNKMIQLGLVKKLGRGPKTRYVSVKYH